MIEDPAVLQYLLEIGALSPERDALARKQAQIDELRASSAMPQMRSAGRVSVASNPLEFLGSVGNTWAAERGNKQLAGMTDAYGQKRRDALRRLMPGQTSTRSAIDPNYVPIAGE